MVDGNAAPDSGNVDTTTVEHAASGILGIAGLFSEEENETPETPPKPKKKQSPPPAPASDEEPDGEDEEPTDDGETAESDDAPEGDDEDTVESDDAEDADDPEPQPQKIRLKNGDEVTVDEIDAGYLRQKDYTRKTQEVAERRKALDTEAAEVRKQRDEYAEYLPKFKQMVESLMDEPVLDESDPEAYAAQHKQWKQQQARLAKIDAEIERTNAERTAEYKKNAERWLEDQRAKVLEFFPSWIDPKVAKAAQKEIAEFGEAQGFSKEELSTFDARAVRLLHSAMLQSRVEKAKQTVKTKIQKGKDAAKPNSSAPTRPDRHTQAAQRLAKTGHVKDAAVAIEGLLK